MKRLDIEKEGLEFKNLLSGPAPVGRILNYIKLSGNNNLYHINGYRYTDLNGKVGSAWATEFMIGLGLLKLGGQVGEKYKLPLTKEGQTIFRIMQSGKDITFNEGVYDSSIMQVKNQINECSSDLYEAYRNAFVKSYPFKILKLFLDENGYKFNDKKKFMDDLFEEVKNLYDSNSTPYNRDSQTTTASNRVPSLLQLCKLFGFLSENNGELQFDESIITNFGVDYSYHPSLEEYDPGLTFEQYESVFSDITIVNRSWLDTLYYLYQMGGEATCKEIADKYGNSPMHYNSNAITVAKKVVQETNCSTNIDKDGNTEYWPVLFIGKYTSGKVGYFTWKLRKPVADAIKSMEEKGLFDNMNSRIEYPKNIILYGPPGTGKTYHTIIYSVAIIEGSAIEDIYEEAKKDYESVKKRYDKYRDNDQIAFTTFHQSYGYEEFIEGIKPQMDSEDNEGSIKYNIERGIFSTFCDQARAKSKVQDNLGLNKSPVVWKVSLGGTGKNPDREECMENGHIRIGFDEHGPEITEETNFSIFGGKTVLNAFMNKMRIGDIIFSCYSASTIDAIGVVTGDYEWHDEYQHLKRLRNVKWLVKDLNYNIIDINNGASMTLSTVYRMNVSLSDVFSILNEVSDNTDYDSEDSDKKYVFIIDEINRGNISKIFGELITLIEPSKRIGQKEELSLILPYSKKPFGVPDNVYLIGTMNTADRSIALMDTALRRRFHFIEMLPDEEILEDIDDIEGINISAMLKMMNNRIELLIDREHMIGHSYFMKLSKTHTLACLSDIFRNNIIPLLQEYFFDDYEKIRLILGDNQKKDVNTQFITKTISDPSKFFGNAEGIDDLASYTIHKNVFDTKPEAYIGIYK